METILTIIAIAFVFADIILAQIMVMQKQKLYYLEGMETTIRTFNQNWIELEHIILDAQQVLQDEKFKRKAMKDFLGGSK